MNEQTSKERVLQTWPNASSIETIADAEHESYFWIYSGEPHSVIDERLGQGETEQEAWDSVASQLPPRPPEPPREDGRHRFMGGTCVDCGHPLEDICTGNLDLPETPAASRLTETTKELPSSPAGGSEFSEDSVRRNGLPDDVFGILHDLCYHHEGRDVNDYVRRAKAALSAAPIAPAAQDDSVAVFNLLTSSLQSKVIELADAEELVQELKEKLEGLIDAIKRVQDWGEDTRVGAALIEANAALTRAERKEGEAKHER